MKVFYATLSVIVILIIAAGLFVWFIWLPSNTNSAPPAYGAKNPVYGALLEDSAAFAAGQRALNAGHYDEAIADFQTALASATDNAQRGQIDYKIAYATEKDPAKGPIQSIPLYKKIAANASYTNITRAYAIQEMAFMPGEYSGVDQITATIFNEEPYKSMYVSGDDQLTYRHLYDYAATFYPLANVEFRIADWYAKAIYDSSTAASSSSEKLDEKTVAAYKDTIRKDLELGEADVARIKKLPNEQGYVPAALQREASVFAYLKLAGDSSFGDPISTMQSVINIEELGGSPGRDGFARYYLAFYLAEFRGSSAFEDVRAALEPIVNDPAYTNGPHAVAPIFREERSDKRDMKPSLVLLAGIDPQFKTYLMGLGWKESDFAGAEH